MLKPTLFVLGSLFALSSPAFATKQTISGRPTMFSVDDGGSTFYTGNVIQVGVRATSTTCGVDPSGTPSTYIRIPETPRGDQMRQAILTAIQLGKPIFVTVDDTVKDSGGKCYAVGMGISSLP